MAIQFAEGVLNFYKHKDCGTHWVDLWECGCNDKCPECNAEIEPYISLSAQEIKAMNKSSNATSPRRTTRQRSRPQI